jgi:hypothetical protein
MASGSHAIYTGSATCLATCLPICLAVHTGHVLTNTGNQGPPFVLVAWRWPRPNFLVLDHSIIVALKLPRLVRLLWRRQNWSILGICDDLFDDGRVLGTKDHDLTIPQTSEHRRNSFSSSEWTYLFLRCCWEGRSHIVDKAVAPSFSMPEQPGHTTPSRTFAKCHFPQTSCSSRLPYICSPRYNHDFDKPSGNAIWVEPTGNASSKVLPPCSSTGAFSHLPG